MVITTFVGLCKSEGLEAPTKAAGARSLLEGGEVATAGEDGKRLAAGDMVERAAALVWARAHRAGADLELWEGLGDSFRAALEVLYPGGKARAGGSSMERVMRAVEFRTTPTVTPEKKKKGSKRRAGGGGDGGSDDEARAEEAVRAAAEAARAEKERRGGGREGGTPGGEERPGKKVRGLRREDEDSDVEVLSPPRRKRGRKALGGGPTVRIEADAEITFTSKYSDLKGLIPANRLHPLDLTRGWEERARMAHEKAAVMGLRVQVVLGFELDFFQGYNEGKSFGEMGAMLAEGGRWKGEGSMAGVRRMAQSERSRGFNKHRTLLNGRRQTGGRTRR